MTTDRGSSDRRGGSRPGLWGDLRKRISRGLAYLPRKYVNRVRGIVRRCTQRWTQIFRSYGREDLVKCLRAVGVREGDTVLLHAAYSESSGFQGSPKGVADAFLEALGESGNLLMVSLPTAGASHEYLRSLKAFDVSRTPSRMGVVSEFFRRRDGVLRSLHPSHPMLAHGPRAEWLLADHEQCLYPCGPDTPFDKALDLDGMVVFFDTGLGKMTFFHWLEHRVRNQVDFPLYFEDPFEVTVIDQERNERTVRTLAFSQEAIDRRRDTILHREMRRQGVVRTCRVGNTRIMAARFKEIVRCVDEMADRGVYFYDCD